MTDEPTPAAEGKLSQHDRFQACIDRLRPLKERKAVREVMEREIMNEFIAVNKSHINEFPMLETQHWGIINLLCARGDENHAQQYVHELIGNFIVLLTRYEVALANGDEEQTTQISAALNNTEALLVRCIQGVVYAMGLVTDNFEELVLRHFGQQALPEYSSLIKEHEPDDRFWRAFMERFIAGQTEAAYDDFIANERYTIGKQGNLLTIRFLFDDILSRLNTSTESIDQTRIQRAYQKNTGLDPASNENKILHGTIAKGLLSMLDPSQIRREDLLTISHIVAIDDLSRQLVESYLESARERKAPPADEDGRKAAQERNIQLQFLMKQITAEAIGVYIALRVVREGIIRTLGAFTSGEIDQLRILVHDIKMTSLEKVLYYLLEHHFSYLIREKVYGEGNKIQIRTLKSRRAKAAAVNGLVDFGMNRIRKSKLWLADPDDPDRLLFRPRARKQLQGVMLVMQFEEELIAKVLETWDDGDDKTEIAAVIDLKQLAKTTTNLRLRLAEMLAKLGIGSKSETQPESPPL